MDENDIKNLATYDPTKVKTPQLKDDWRIVTAWYSQILMGREFTYSKEQVINVATLIFEELKKRDIKFHPEEMKPNARELFNIVSKGKLKKGKDLEDIHAQPGIILVEPHGEQLIEGEKTLVVKSKKFNILDKVFLVIQGNTAMGAVEFGSVKEIDLEEFNKLRGQHKITEEERKKWWPDKEKFWAYKPSIVIKFKKPRKIHRPKGTQTFIKSVKLVGEDDNRDLAEIIRSGERFGPNITLEDVLPHFKDFYITKPYIYLVGGLCNHPQDGTTGDIDILIRQRKPTSNEALPMVFRVYRMFPREMWDRIQILWSNDDFGPFTNFIPLYDQLIERRQEDGKQLVLMNEGEDGGMEPVIYPEFQEDADVPNEPTTEDVLRTEKPEIISMAKESRERGIKPMRFFEMLKGIAGYRKLEKFTPEGVLAVTKPADYPYEVDQKFDGLRLQLHKKGDKVKILSIDGANHTNRLFFIADELKKIPHDVVLDAEMTGWTKGFRKGTHLGRSDVSGFLHAKARLPHHNFFANVFDLLYLDGKDLHNEPLAERRAQLETLKSSEHIKVIDMKVARNPKEMLSAIKWASGFPASEGAMIKSLKSTYPLSGLTSKWIKFKKEADIDAEVIAVHSVKGSKAKNYLMIIRTARGDPIPVGRTYNTSIQASVGDILRVAFVNMNMYTDPKTQKVWFNWWSPRVIELREDKDKPDTDATARTIHEETKGEAGEKPFPKRYKELLKVDKINEFLLDYPYNELVEATTLFDLTSDETKELHSRIPATFGNAATVNDVFDANPYLTPGDEDKVWKFVVQNHYRGKSVHQDLRMERPSFLVGFTLNVQKKGKPSEDIETVAQAKAFTKNPGNFKNFRRSTPGFQQVVAETKAPEPLVWLGVEGKFDPGEIGATKEKPGIFDIAARGEVEFGTQKPAFHEYWLHDKKGILKYNGRLVLRLLKNIWGPELTGRGKFVWMAWFTKEQRPYILTKRAVDLGEMPPTGLSWLPRAVRRRIPRELQYWKQKDKKKARKIRDDLSKLVRTRKVNLDFSSQDFPNQGKFTLSKICWRGPLVVRFGCSREEYHVFLEMNSKVYDIILNGNPIELPKVSAVIGEPKDKAALTMQGKVPNKTKLNPDLETPATISILDKGTFKRLSLDINKIEADYKGKKLKGKYVLQRTRPKTTLWQFKKA
jgi:hypothetical protein